MTIREHNNNCRCTTANPCATLAAILREQHYGPLFEVTDPGRFPRTPATTPTPASTDREAA